jgi:predicted alpha/beta superfamily hydrolase
MQSLRIFIAILSCLIGAGAFASMTVKSEGKAVQLRTDELLIHSKRIGRDFLVEVTRLDQVQPGRKYAAVYAVDGGLGVAGPASRLLIAGNRTVPFFVVSIGYANAMGRHVGPRNTDLVHRPFAWGERTLGGGGAAFEAFIREDLRPYLERRYPLDPARAVLLGHSGGGLFAASILVTHPDAFFGYVIGGVPLLWKGKEDIFLIENAKASAPRANGQRVFIGLAPLDALNTQSDQLAAHLSGPASRFKVRQELFTEETHNSEYLQLIARGLPFVLPTETAEMTAVAVKPVILDRYVGTYRLDAQRVLEISRRGAELYGRVNSLADEYLDVGGLFPFEAADETRFFSRSADVIVTFDAPRNGKSPSLTARTYAQETTAMREK